MIDFAHLYHDVYIHWRSMNPMMWYRSTLPDGRECYCHSIRGVKIRYYPDRERITIKGKLLMLLHDTRVLNVDDVYGADLERFISEINAYLNHLFTRPLLDIRAFRVSRIDYCFNIKTPYVKEYLAFMSRAFQRCNSERRVDFTAENGFTGSVYVRTASDYAHYECRNYTLNYYDKADRLRYQAKQGKQISAADFSAACNVLRLEVQCGFQFLRNFCKRLQIQQLFGTLLSYEVAFQAEKAVYERVFSAGETHNFFTYKAAKALLPARSQAAKAVLKKASTHHSINTSQCEYGKRRIKEAGIYPFCFLPKNCGLICLENPLKLIRSKLVELGVLLHQSTETIEAEKEAI